MSYKILVCCRKVKDLNDTFERFVNNKYEEKGDYYVDQGSSGGTKCSFYVKKDTFVGLDKSLVIPSDDEKKGFDGFWVVIDCYRSVVDAKNLGLKMGQAFCNDDFFVFWFTVGSSSVIGKNSRNAMKLARCCKIGYYFGKTVLIGIWNESSGFNAKPCCNCSSDLNEFYSIFAKAVKNNIIRTTAK